MSFLGWLGCLLAVALGFALPRWGGRAWWLRRQERRRREWREDALKHLLKCEVEGAAASLLSLAGALRQGDEVAATVVAELERDDLAGVEAGRLRLRPAGREIALHVVRAHRLWESYLAERTGEPESRWHRLAERAEHRLTPAETAALEKRNADPAFYARDAAGFAKATGALGAAQAALQQAETRWLELEILREESGG